MTDLFGNYASSVPESQRVGDEPRSYDSLAAGFAYANESSHLTPGASLGHDQLAATLTSRLRHSSGGAVLISGFRGTGKTTLVRRALDGLRDQCQDDSLVVAKLNVSRRISGSALLFNIMRRLVEELIDQRVLDNVPPEVRSAILLAYARTSMSISRKESEGRETATGVTLKITPGGPIASGSLVSGLSSTSKRTRSTELATSFLTYSESDVEYDLLKIVELLSRNPPRIRHRWWHVRRTTRPVRLVVILDELDKLSESESGVAAFGEILGALKNVLTAASLHVLAITGVEVLDESELEGLLGNGIYESIFSWRMYVPCLWRAPDVLLDTWLPVENPNRPILQGYLEFKSRGVARRLLQEFNELVTVDATSARLDLDATAKSRIAFYATVYEALDGFLTQIEIRDRTGLSADRQRLACYYAVDWMLRTEGGPFTAEELLSDPRGISKLMLPQAQQLHTLLEHLVVEQFLERVSHASDLFTRFGFADHPTAFYRLSETVRDGLRDLVATSDRERVFLLTRLDDNRPPSQPPPRNAPSSHKIGTIVPGQQRARATGPAAGEDGDPNWEVAREEQFLANGRYSLTRLLGAGGTGLVYQARDQALGEECAIKVVRKGPNNERLEHQLAIEARIGAMLRHPGVVQIRQLLREPDGRAALIMDYVRGASLRDLIDEGRSPGESLAIVRELLETLVYIHGQGVIRLDLKPENIVVTDDGAPVIIDLGIALEGRLGDFGIEGSTESENAESRAPRVSVVHDHTIELVGTPRYMAPEQWRGPAIDQRVDLYAVGIIAAELLGARRDAASLAPTELIRLFQQDFGKEIESQLSGRVSQSLLAWLRRMVAQDPADRPTGAEIARRELDLVPEALPEAG